MAVRQRGDDAIVGELPYSLQRLVNFERDNLHKVAEFQCGGLDPAFDIGYFPQNCGAFSLPCYWFPREVLIVYGGIDCEEGREGLLGPTDSGGRVLFPIHPTALNSYKRLISYTGARSVESTGQRVWAVPTSSTRTLLAWPEGDPDRAIFVKTSLHSTILGDRRIHQRKAAAGVGFSRILSHDRQLWPKEFLLFPESMSVVLRAMPDSGAIFRRIPREILDCEVVPAPLFALMGGKKPLALDLLRNTDLGAREFFDRYFSAPFARLWLQMSLNLGLTIEAHCQDLLISLSPDLVPSGRFFYRDCEGIQADWHLRRTLCLSGPSNLPGDWRWNETYGAVGYRYSGLVFYKWYTSIFHFTDLFLKELQSSLASWAGAGLIEKVSSNEPRLTESFSSIVFAQLDEMFGHRISDKFDLSESKTRFLLILWNVRAEVMRRAIEART